MFSIILPVFNAEKYIYSCLNSISASVEKDFEVIVVDDGSNDNSGAICDRFSQNDNRFKVFHNKNAGASAARNFGIEKAIGEYIIFVDADDYVLEKRLSAIKEHIGQYDFIYAGYRDLRETGDYKSYGLFDQSFSFEEYRRLLSEDKVPIPSFVWCGGYHKDIINNNRIRFKTDSLIGEDILFNLEYLSICKNIKFIENDEYIHRENISSLVHRYYPDRELKEEKECRAIEGLCNCKLLSKRYYYWHVALNHFEIWEKKGNPDTKKSARNNHKKSFHNKYFRASIPFKRTNGSLDEKIETFFMGYYRHKIYKMLLPLLKILHNLKHGNH